MSAVCKLRCNCHSFCCLGFDINAFCKFIYICTICHDICDLVYCFSCKACIFCKCHLIHLQPHFVHMAHAVFSAVCCFKDHTLDSGVDFKISILSCIAEIFCAVLFYIDLIISPVRRGIKCCLCICNSCFYIKFSCTVCSVCIQCFVLSRLYCWSTSQCNTCCFCIYAVFRKFFCS